MTRWLRATLFLVFISPVAGAADPLLYNDTFDAFGTVISITIYGKSPSQARQISTAIVSDLHHMHGFWHPWEAGPLARINGLLPLTAPFTASPSTLPLFRDSPRLSRDSEYLFNPAIGGLVRLWGFHRASENMPDKPPQAAKIQELLKKNPTMDDLTLKGLILNNRNPAVILDFGAFAKGLAVDQSINRLKELGVKNAIINAGGDLRAYGRKGERRWRIGVKHPRKNGMIALLEIEGDESVFTSGDYERFYMYEGKRYHHILDPRTGYPATGSISVTVIHDSAASADAAATALFVAGPKDWRRIAKRMGVDLAMLVGSDHKIYMTAAMAKRMRLENNDYPVVEVP